MVWDRFIKRDIKENPFLFDMDDKTNIKELKDIVQKFCEDRDWTQFHNAKELSIGISTEAAELLQHFRFKSESEVDAMFKDIVKRKELTGEIADIFFFLLRLTQKYDVDLSDELKHKITKINKKYPINKVKGSNKRYTEY